MTGIFQGLKDVIRNSNLFKVLTCGAAVVPTSPGRVIVDETAQGMRLLYTADTIMEAEKYGGGKVGTVKTFYLRSAWHAVTSVFYG